MTLLQFKAIVFVLVPLLLYFAVELGWGGGDPNHKDHDSLFGGRHLW